MSAEPAGTFSDVVIYELSEGVATVTLNRPESLNSMNNELMTGLGDACERIRADERVRVAVVTGAGRGFCAGADLTSLQGNSSGSAGTDRDLGDFIADSMDTVFHPAVRAFADLPVPTLAKINGVAAGGGVGLALNCDLTVAARSASFVATFGPRLGIVPDLGTTWHLAHRVGRAKALGIAMLGDKITAEEAERSGLIWQVVDDGELDMTVAGLAERLARCSPKAMTSIRSAVDSAPSRALADHLDVEREHQRQLARINMAEGIEAFLGKREPNFSDQR